MFVSVMKPNFQIVVHRERHIVVLCLFLRFYIPGLICIEKSCREKFSGYCIYKANSSLDTSQSAS